MKNKRHCDRWQVKKKPHMQWFTLYYHICKSYKRWLTTSLNMLRHRMPANKPAPIFNLTCFTPQKSATSSGVIQRAGGKVECTPVVIVLSLHSGINFNSVEKWVGLFHVLAKCNASYTPLRLIRNLSLCLLVALKWTGPSWWCLSMGVFDLVAFHWSARWWDFYLKGSSDRHSLWAAFFKRAKVIFKNFLHLLLLMRKWPFKETWAEGRGWAADFGRIHIKESPGCNSERRSPRVEDEELIIL